MIIQCSHTYQLKGKTILNDYSLVLPQCHLGGALLHLCHHLGSWDVHALRYPLCSVRHPTQCDGVHLCRPHILPVVQWGLSVVVAIYLQCWVSFLFVSPPPFFIKKLFKLPSGIWRIVLTSLRKNSSYEQKQHYLKKYLCSSEPSHCLTSQYSPHGVWTIYVQNIANLEYCLKLCMVLRNKKKLYINSKLAGTTMCKSLLCECWLWEEPVWSRHCEQYTLLVYVNPLSVWPVDVCLIVFE